MAEHYEPQVGDVVRVGRGKKTWRVAYFWEAPDGTRIARLGPIDDGHTYTSTDPGRLVLVERPGQVTS